MVESTVFCVVIIHLYLWFFGKSSKVGRSYERVYSKLFLPCTYVVWDDDFEADKNVPMSHPTLDRTLQLMLENPTSKWFDNVSTKKVETLNEIITTSWNAGLDTLIKKHGPMGENWQWYKVKQTGIRHLIPGMDALSRLKIPIGGGSGIVNASSTKSGPSWRLVVELSKKGNPKAYGVYPGGQSGNPGSTHYDDLIDTWAKGE